MNFYSSEDMLGMVAEINVRRLPKILGDLAKRAGGPDQLKRQIGEQTERLLVDIRQLHQRYQRGELTHTENDEARLKAAAEWLVAQHAGLRGLQPREFDWDASKLRRAEPLHKRTYRKVLTNLARY